MVLILIFSSSCFQKIGQKHDYPIICKYIPTPSTREKVEKTFKPL